MKALLKWWLIFCLSCLGLSIFVWFDFHITLYDADVTKLSFFIILVFLITTLWIGNKTYRIERENDYSENIDVGWFIAEVCLALGMIGTVTGFLFMLGTAFQNIDVSNTVSLQNALMLMAKGMSTALYTTLAGLICSLIIKIQLVNIEVALRE